MDLNEGLEQARRAEAAGDWAAAVKLYESLRVAHSDDNGILERLAWCLSQAKHYDEAIQTLQQLVKHQPAVAKWPYMIGYQYAEQQRWADALKWYDCALQIEPNYVVVLYRKGYAHAQRREVGESLRAFTKCRSVWHALTDGPSKRKDQGNCAKAAYHQAEVLLDNKKMIHGGISECVTLLREAIALDPDDHNKHYLLGKALLETGRPEEAVMSFASADRLKPGEDYVLDRWALALMQLGRLGEAEHLYQRIPERQRKAYVLVNLGGLYEKMGRYDECIAAFRQAAQRDRRSHKAHFYLGVGYCLIGRWPEAVQELREAIALRKRNFRVPYPEAEQKLQEIIRDHPDAGTRPVALVPRECRGTIVKFIEDRGFGFIRLDDGEEVFFHIRDCSVRELVTVGARVRFEVITEDRGPRAYKVTPID